MKPNCYECKHRRSVPGDAHSQCVHPALGEVPDNPFGAIVQMLNGQASEAARKLHVTGNEHGIRSGWFLWPVNFDPVWLVTCDGFQEHVQDLLDG